MRSATDPVELWMAEFYGGIGTKLKDLMAERPDELDPAVVATLSAGLDRSMVEFFTQVFARYEFREQMRQLFEPLRSAALADVALRPPSTWVTTRRRG